MAVSVEANAVIMMPRMSWSSCFAARSTSTPLMSGMLMSEISTSTGSPPRSPPAPEALARRVAVVGEHDVVALAPQHDREQLPHRLLIVDDENTGGPSIG